MIENTVNENAVLTTGVVEVERGDLNLMVTPSSLVNPEAGQLYCSIQNDGTKESKKAIYNAMQNSQKKISECIGEAINLKDIIAHQIEIIDEQTGEIIRPLRVVLIDDKGVSYEAVSNGVANAVQRILEIYGQPATWDEPLKVKPKQKQTRNGNNKVTTLEIV